MDASLSPIEIEGPPSGEVRHRARVRDDEAPGGQVEREEIAPESLVSAREPAAVFGFALDDRARIDRLEAGRDGNGRGGRGVRGQGRPSPRPRDEAREPDAREDAERGVERGQVAVVVAHLMLRQDEEPDEHERGGQGRPERKSLACSRFMGRRVKAATISGEKCSAGPRSHMPTSGQPGRSPGVASLT